MNIIKFTCLVCNDNLEKYHPIIELESLNDALEHLRKFPSHIVVIPEPEFEVNED